MRDSSFDMPAAGRSPLLALCVTLALTMTLVMVVSGPADAQTPTTPAPAVAVTAAPATSAPVSTGVDVTTTAAAVTTTVPKAGDDESTRTVDRIVALLVALAVVLLGLALWFWRSTKPVARHLDGLDLMATRPWRDGDGEARAALLASVHERRADDIHELSDGAVGEVVVVDEDVAADPSVAAASPNVDEVPVEGVPVDPVAAEAGVAAGDPVVGAETAVLAGALDTVAVIAADHPADAVEEPATAPRVS